MTRGRVLRRARRPRDQRRLPLARIRDATRTRSAQRSRMRRSGSFSLAVLVLASATSSRRALAADRGRAACCGSARFYEMVLGGLACNNVLPVRIGEIVRAGWLSREAPMPGGRALGSVALDRACDVVTLAVFLVIGLQAVPTPDVAQAHRRRRRARRRASSPPHSSSRG